MDMNWNQADRPGFHRRSSFGQYELRIAFQFPEGRQTFFMRSEWADQDPVPRLRRGNLSGHDFYILVFQMKNLL